MSALVGDILEDRIDVPTATAVTNAGRQLLRVVELQYRYAGVGERDAEAGDVPRDLRLTGPRD